MKFRKLLALLLILGLLTAGSGMAFAQENTPQIQVMLDGQYLNFPDVLPTIVNDRTLVPIGPIMDSLGATYTYTPETQVIATQYGDTTVYLAIGEPGMTIEKAGETQPVDLDVAPVVIGDRTMVPVRLLNLAFGLSTSWDAANQTVVIIDFAKLQSQIDQNYSITNRLMHSYNPQTTYAVTGDITQKADMTAAPLGDSVSVTTTNTFKMLVQNNNFSVDYHVNMDMDMDAVNLPEEITPGEVTSEEATTEEATTEDLSNELADFTDYTMKFIFNSRTATLYANLGSLTSMLFMDYDADTWFKLNLLDLVPDPAMAAKIQNTLNSNVPLTLGDYFDLCLNRSDAYNIRTYETMEFALDLCNPLFSDRAYTLSGTEEQPTYTYQISTASIISAVRSTLIKHPTFAPNTLAVLSKIPQNAVQFKLNSTVTLLDNYQQTGSSKLDFSFDFVEVDKAMGISLLLDKYLYSGSMQSETNIPGESTLSSTYQIFIQDGEMEMNANQNMEGSVDAVVTTEKIPSAPPANSKIKAVDLKGLFSGGGMMHSFSIGIL